MAAVVASKATLTAHPSEELSKKTHVKIDPTKVDIIRLPTGDVEDNEPSPDKPSRTALHIYFENGLRHKFVTPTLSPAQERRFGPSPKQQKARRLAKKAAKKARLVDPTPHTALTPQTPSDSDQSTYFLHTPYLSFHLPPSVLYIGSDSHAPARPVALVHAGCFWHTYKIQLGSSLCVPGVVDPRGVVSWRHNGGSKADLTRDERALKGYKVRGWRLWGETGKQYVHGIRDKRKAGVVFDDPDVDVDVNVVKQEDETREKARADEVVYLEWHNPLSRQTRMYTFSFRGIEFQWKGTGTVNEPKKCGWMLRFCHLKLVARIPLSDAEKARKIQKRTEVCLAKYVSSIAAEKSGTLEVFDGAVLRFVGQHLPDLLRDEGSGEESEHDSDEDEKKMKRLKKGVLYQLIVATSLCMANAEKEKRHTLIDLVIGIAENGGNGGG